MLQNVLDAMNPAQRNAATSDARVLQILAGPGSGKTRVLTTRVAWLVQQKQINPTCILVVTFTNKAAKEMRNRLLSEDLLGETSKKLAMGTFHASCSSFLRRYGSRIGIKPNFSIADTSVSTKIIQEVMKDLKIYGQPVFFRDAISKAKCQGINCDEYQARFSQENNRKQTCIVYSAYQRQLKKDNALDFDDLLLEGCRLLETDPSITSFLQYILVDEYQDTNKVQYDLLKLLTHGNKALTIVGDPDQSIYGFRNADVTNFLKMKDDYRNVQVARLEQNYRSTTAILNAASVVINNDQSRIPKELYTHNCDGVPMSWLLYNRPEDEAEALVEEILRVQKFSNGIMTNEDFCILVRINSFTLNYERELSRNQIPYRVRGGMRFFDRAEIKDMLAYLRLIANPNDSDAFFRIINVPKRGIGDTIANRIKVISEEKQCSMIEALAELAGSGGRRSNNNGQRALNGPTLKNVKEFLEMMDSFQVLASAKSAVGIIVEAILRATDMKAYLKHKHAKDGPKKWEEHWANIEELLSHAHGFQHTSPSQSQNEEELDPLIQFLNSTSLDIDEGQKNDDEGRKCVTLSTYHSAKGLEWPVVFNTGCEKGIIPYHKCQTKDEIQEECRLLYVGMTRAQCFLYCTEVQCRRNPWSSDWIKCTTTEFLREMPQDLFQRQYPRLDHSARKWISVLLNRDLPQENVTLKDEGTHYVYPASIPRESSPSDDDDEEYSGSDSADYFNHNDYNPDYKHYDGISWRSRNDDGSKSRAAVYAGRRTTTFGSNAGISSQKKSSKQLSTGKKTAGYQASSSSATQATSPIKDQELSTDLSVLSPMMTRVLQPLYVHSPFSSSKRQNSEAAAGAKTASKKNTNFNSMQGSSFTPPTQPYSGFTTASQVHRHSQDKGIYVKKEENSQEVPLKRSKGSTSKGSKKKSVKEEFDDMNDKFSSSQRSSASTQPYSGFTSASQVHKQSQGNGVYVKNEEDRQEALLKRSKSSTNKSKKKKVMKEGPIDLDLSECSATPVNNATVKKEEASGYKSVWTRYLKKEGDDLNLKRQETELSAMILDCLQRIPNERGELTSSRAITVVASNAAKKNMAISQMDVEFRVGFELQKLVDQGILYRKTGDMYVIPN